MQDLLWDFGAYFTPRRRRRQGLETRSKGDDD